jgi:carboxylesterase type B
MGNSLLMTKISAHRFGPSQLVRWLPPQKLEYNASHVFDATQYPPSCAQYVSKVPTIWNSVTTEYIISGPISEDCLALSIWTPMEAKELPVLMFITGGGFQTGGVEINYQLPYNWVERTQAHIVVTIK